MNSETSFNTKLIETQNVKAVKSAVKNAVQHNRMTAVVAEIGAGKTTLYNHLAEYWEQYPHRFRIVTMKGFDMRRSRASVIIRLLLSKLNPQANIPVSIELMYKMLELELRAFCKSSNNRVILMIDEAQDMPWQTFCDIKKIHEIGGFGKDHLLSIILFGKTHKKWNRFVGTPELGYRSNYLVLDKLNNDDLLKLAEEKYGLKFENSRIRDRFGSVLNFKTPLGVEFFARVVRKELGIDDSEPAIVTADLAIKVPMLGLKIMCKQEGMTHAELAGVLDKAIPNKKINVQRVSEYFNGKINDEGLNRDITLVLEDMLNKRSTDRKMRASGEE